jgi:hypothetical protein
MRLRSPSLISATLRSAVMLLALGSISCAPRSDEPAPTPLPTRQSTIDPVTKKLEAAQQDTERRRTEVDAASR